MSVQTVARRYATALADVVLKTGETDVVKAELKTWEQLLVANADLQNAFGNPAIAHISKEKVLENLIGKTNPSKTTANFLKILLRNGRLMEIDEINERFESVLAERIGVISAEAISAHELNAAQQTELRNNLEKLTGKKVNLNFAVDQALIGGVVTRVGSTIYDGSVKTQLENLKEEMIGS